MLKGIILVICIVVIVCAGILASLFIFQGPDLSKYEFLKTPRIIL